MGSSITFRVRSLAWFVTGAVLAAAVTLMFVNAWRVDAAPGDSDSTFVPIAPCRLADTRPEPTRVGTADSLGPASTTVFQATGTNGECTLPGDAVSLSLNITALGATIQSFLTVWGDGEQPLAASLNPAPGEPPTPNAVTTPLSASGAFNVYNDVGTVDVVIDVVGYYTKASLQELASRLAAAEASASANASGLTALDGRLAAVEASASANASGLTALDGRVDAVESELDGKQDACAAGAVLGYATVVPTDLTAAPTAVPGFNCTGGAVTAARSDVGEFRVTFEGLQTEDSGTTNGLNVQITAIGTNGGTVVGYGRVLSSGVINVATFFDRVAAEAPRDAVFSITLLDPGFEDAP